MNAVKVRFRNGTNKKIRLTQPLITFICPIEVEVGEYVVVETGQPHKKHSDENFRVGRVEEIFEGTELIKKERLYHFVLSKIDVDDFDRQCRKISILKYKIRAKYREAKKQKIESMKSTADKD